MTQSKDAMTAARPVLAARHLPILGAPTGPDGSTLTEWLASATTWMEEFLDKGHPIPAGVGEVALRREVTLARALLNAMQRETVTHPAPEHYNDIRLAPYLSSGTWSYQIVATEYHGNEVRINVDPDTLVRFASEALAAAVADESDANGYWTRPWAES